MLASYAAWIRVNVPVRLYFPCSSSPSDSCFKSTWCFHVGVTLFVFKSPMETDKLKVPCRWGEKQRVVKMKLWNLRGGGSNNPNNPFNARSTRNVLNTGEMREMDLWSYLAACVSSVKEAISAANWFLPQHHHQPRPTQPLHTCTCWSTSCLRKHRPPILTPLCLQFRWCMLEMGRLTD